MMFGRIGYSLVTMVEREPRLLAPAWDLLEVLGALHPSGAVVGTITM